MATVTSTEHGNLRFFSFSKLWLSPNFHACCGKTYRITICRHWAGYQNCARIDFVTVDFAFKLFFSRAGLLNMWLLGFAQTFEFPLLFKKFEIIFSSSSMSLMCCFSLSCGKAVSFSSSKSSSNVCMFKSSIAFCSSCIY